LVDIPWHSLVTETAGCHIRYTCKRIGRDDRLDDRVERRNVCNRIRKFADRTFGFAACTKSAIVLSGSRPWVLGLNITLWDGGA
jgi:hypothetical protein